MAASALPETLRSITATKIQELTQQRENFETAKSSILDKAASAKDSLAATSALLEGTRHLRNVKFLNDESSGDDDYKSSGSTAFRLRNKHLLLRQAGVDPSVDSSVVDDIHKSLQRELELESVRHRHAEFFSQLVTEWLSNPDDEAQASESTSFEEVGRKEMHEQRAMWESLVFNESNTDGAKIETYLKDLFTSTKASGFAHEILVKQTKAFSSELLDMKDLFDADSLKGTMAGLLNTDLMTEEKSATLRTFMANKEVLTEVADVLNMRYASLTTWKWTCSRNGIPVEMRRQLNGKYRVFMDEDVLDALLLYELGLKWSVHFKTNFSVFFNSLAWKRSEKHIPKKDRERREFFLEKEQNLTHHTVQSFRRVRYASDYFMTQLPVDEKSGKRNYDEDNDEEDTTAKSKGALELKHGLLHKLVAESLIARHLNPDTEHTVIRSDFKWFGPALPHETVFTVLKYFGVDDIWLEFFRKFLQTPIWFINDGPKAQVQVRKRGIPLSHTLSDVFGEAVMFVMDFAVNQATSSYLYRLHDDFWFWGSTDTCLSAWQSMTKFANVMGIEFNEEKTGTVRFGVPADSSTSSDTDTSDNESPAYSPQTKSLPIGEVRWGFLRLDAATGRFLVDQAQVDEHIAELQLQLSYCKSIFSYVQSYNAYANRFFTNNFGKPSYAFGREHVDMMISTFARIQKKLFPSGNVTDHLASLAKERFNIENLPSGFWYFPVENGGVELRNPLIPLLGMRETLRKSPQRMLKKAYDQDESQYLIAQTKFKEHGSTSGFGKYKADLVRTILDAGETFMPKEEYMRYREERSSALGQLYQDFLTVPSEEELNSTPELAMLMTAGQGEYSTKAPSKRSAIRDSFDAMQPYWRWMVALYGKDIVEHYGSLKMVDQGQVPIGIVSLMKKGRVRWRG